MLALLSPLGIFGRRPAPNHSVKSDRSLASAVPFSLTPAGCRRRISAALRAIRRACHLQNTNRSLSMLRTATALAAFVVLFAPPRVTVADDAYENAFLDYFRNRKAD